MDHPGKFAYHVVTGLADIMPTENPLPAQSGVRIPLSTNPDWLDIPRFEFEIRGIDGSSIHFASETVLARRVVFTGVVSFDATLTLRTPYSTFQHPFQLADYSGLRPFRDGLSAIRNGTGDTASMAGAGFSLAIGSHQTDAREGLLVEGYCSSIHDPKYSPWPARKPIGDLVLFDRESIACIRFAFLSSLVDPPYVDNAIAGIEAIIQYLEGEGFQP